MITSLLARLKKSKEDTPALLHSNFGVLACDPDSHGNANIMNAFPACPHCGAKDIAAWGFHERCTPVELDVPSVTHRHWNSLEISDRYKLVHSTLEARVGLMR